jgi:hypothetical protein
LHEENHFCRDIDEVDERLGALANPDQGKAGQDGDKQDLKNVAVGECADECVRNDVHDERHESDFVRQLDVRLDHRRIELADIDVHADAGFEDIDRQQTDDERHRGHHLEIDDRLDGDAADPRHVGHMRDPRDHGAEDDRRDQHADKLDEGIAERAHADGGIGRRHAERDAGRHADQDPDPELGPPWPAAAGLSG